MRNWKCWGSSNAVITKVLFRSLVTLLFLTGKLLYTSIKYNFVSICRVSTYRCVIISDVVDWVHEITDASIGQRMMNDVSLITGRRDVKWIDRNRTGQWHAAAAQDRRTPAIAAAALWWGRPPLIVHCCRDCYRRVHATRVAIVDFVPVIAQRRTRARLHLYVGHIWRHVRIFGRGAMFVVRIRFSSVVSCGTDKLIIYN